MKEVTNRFNGFPYERKPLETVSRQRVLFTGLKPGVNEKGLWGKALPEQISFNEVQIIMVEVGVGPVVIRLQENMLLERRIFLRLRLLGHQWCFRRRASGVGGLGLFGSFT